MPKQQTLDSLISEAKRIHENKYDYSLITEYKGMTYKYPIICPEHGVFYKSFNKHIHQKQGCPKCAGRFRYNTDSFIETLKQLPHCEGYTFDKVKYVNNKTKVIITCPLHGDFEITPGHLLSGEGCPKCRYIKSSAGKRRGIEKVIGLAREVHGDKYDYSLITDYKNDRIKYPIICPEHGVFYQTMNSHIKGKQGCPKCGCKKSHEQRRLTFKEWEALAKQVHNGYYTYDKDTYHGTEQKTLITCPKHGDFWQKASNHVNLRQGCPRCANNSSRAEDEINDFIKSLGYETETRKKMLDGLEIDIYVPEKNFGVEFNGLYWHCELSKDKDYHLFKTIKAEQRGIKLFHIFEDEWYFKQDIIKSMISNSLGCTKEKIYARLCEVKEISTAIAKDFLNANHLQGYCPASIRLGLYFKNKLAAVMTFGNSRHFIGNNKYQYELLRFCNILNTTVIGGANKLFKHFIEKIQPETVVSYADRRWSSGNLYDILGFEKYNESKPNYYYIINNKRVYRFNMRKSVLIKKYGCPPEKTEREFCLEQKWYRIYDCGCLCYIWKKDEENF